MEERTLFEYPHHLLGQRLVVRIINICDDARCGRTGSHASVRNLRFVDAFRSLALLGRLPLPGTVVIALRLARPAADALV